jgi:hypothetical protein
MFTRCADDSLQIALLLTDFDLEKEDDKYYAQVAKNQNPVGLNKKFSANIDFNCSTAHFHSHKRIPYEMQLGSDEPKGNYNLALSRNQGVIIDPANLVEHINNPHLENECQSVVHTVVKCLKYKE